MTSWVSFLFVCANHASKGSLLRNPVLFDVVVGAVRFHEVEDFVERNRFGQSFAFAAGVGASACETESNSLDEKAIHALLSLGGVHFRQFCLLAKEEGGAHGHFVLASKIRVLVFVSSDDALDLHGRELRVEARFRVFGSTG